MNHDQATAFRRIVIRPPNWLGDAVLALPAVTALRHAFSAAEVTVAAVPSVAPIFREDLGIPFDRVLDLPNASREVIAMLEGGGFDLGILFPNSFRSAWQLRRAGVKARWGYATAGRGLVLTRRSSRGGARRSRHHADYYRALVRGLGVACDDAAPRLRASGPTAERAAALLAQHGVDPATTLIGFAPGAAYGQAKQWPPTRMAEVIERVSREHDATCVLLGAAHDRAAAREIESFLRARAPKSAVRVVDLVGRTSLAALIGVSARCRVFISNDSGAMHVAAALGRPVVAIFGPTDERATSPVGEHDVITEPVFCRPCLLRDCPIDHRCMKRITVDRVFAAVSARLASPTA